MSTWPILSLIIFLPLIGAAAIFMQRGDEATVARSARWIALWTTLAVFLVSLYLWAYFDRTTAEFQFVEKHAWIGDGVTYHLGIDGLSVLLVLFTTFIMPLCILASWEAIETRVREY